MFYVEQQTRLMSAFITLFMNSCTKLAKVGFQIKSCHCSIAVLFGCYYGFLRRKKLISTMKQYNHETMVVASPR